MGPRSVTLPLGTRVSFTISEQNSCDETATGGVTRKCVCQGMVTSLGMH
jgi:hypothetical protein